nr:MAG TPA: Immunoglobulin I-set domain [Caudoviricetes sp.]
MGTCLLVRRGGVVKKLPVLNPSYPQDQTVWGEGGSATFQVRITVPGSPASYTYRWYRNGVQVSGAAGSSCTFSNLTTATIDTVYCVVSNEAGDVQSRTATLTVKNPNLVYTYQGESEKVDDGGGNWHINLNSSGKLNITSLGKWDGKTDLFVLGAGGAGVNVNGAAPGGGGYYQTVNSIYLREGLDFSVIIGAGATTVGVNGGNSSMAGTTVNGGGAAAGGTGEYYKDCKIQNRDGPGGNVYYYNNLSSTGQSIGNGIQTVNLKYPMETGTTTGGVPVTRAADGGWYSGYVTNWGTLVYSAGTAGVGAAQTQVFGTGDLVSGPGGTANASRPGQGGGSSGIQGGNGLVVLRNGRSTAISITAQPKDVSAQESANAIFSITASGTGLTYQWQFLPTSGNDAKDWGNTSITGATTSALTVQALSYRAGYQYRCVVTDSSGNTAISAPAVLTIAS